MTTPRFVISEEDPIPRLMREIIYRLVDDQHSVRVNSVEEEGLTTLNVHVAPSDIGKLIGRQGRTAKSLRTVLSAAGMKLHHRYALNIEEEDSAT